jgi:hypothetical protein
MISPVRYRYAVGVIEPCPDTPEVTACKGDSSYLATDIGKTLRAFTVFVLAFNCATNFLTVVSELKNATFARVNQVGSMRVPLMRLFVFVAVRRKLAQRYTDQQSNDFSISPPPPG